MSMHNARARGATRSFENYPGYCPCMMQAQGSYGRVIECARRFELPVLLCRAFFSFTVWLCFEWSWVYAGEFTFLPRLQCGFYRGEAFLLAGGTGSGVKFFFFSNCLFMESLK